MSKVPLSARKGNTYVFWKLSHFSFLWRVLFTYLYVNHLFKCCQICTYHIFPYHILPYTHFSYIYFSFICIFKHLWDKFWPQPSVRQIRLKEEINVKSEELDVRLRCYNEFQMASARNAERDSRRTAVSSRKRNGAISEDLDDDDKSEMLRRKSEIFFSRARWKLTEQVGPLLMPLTNVWNYAYEDLILRENLSGWPVGDWGC